MEADQGYSGPFYPVGYYHQWEWDVDSNLGYHNNIKRGY